MIKVGGNRARHHFQQLGTIIISKLLNKNSQTLIPNIPAGILNNTEQQNQCLFP